MPAGLSPRRKADQSRSRLLPTRARARVVPLPISPSTSRPYHSLSARSTSLNVSPAILRMPRPKRTATTFRAAQRNPWPLIAPALQWAALLQPVDPPRVAVPAATQVAPAAAPAPRARRPLSLVVLPWPSVQTRSTARVSLPLASWHSSPALNSERAGQRAARRVAPR